MEQRTTRSGRIVKPVQRYVHPDAKLIDTSDKKAFKQLLCEEESDYEIDVSSDEDMAIIDSDGEVLDDGWEQERLAIKNDEESDYEPEESESESESSDEEDNDDEEENEENEEDVDEDEEVVEAWADELKGYNEEDEDSDENEQDLK